MDVSGIQTATEERLFGEHVYTKAKSRWRCSACLARQGRLPLPSGKMNSGRHLSAVEVGGPAQDTGAPCNRPHRPRPEEQVLQAWQWGCPCAAAGRASPQAPLPAPGRGRTTEGRVPRDACSQTLTTVPNVSEPRLHYDSSQRGVFLRTLTVKIKYTSEGKD